MKLDQKRLSRQKKSFQFWLDANCSGILEAVTGFGKTFVAVLAIQAMNKRNPDFTTIVIVPTTKLKQDWTGHWLENEETGDKEWVPGHIEKFDLKHVQVFVVNTYVKYQEWECDFLIMDEIHHYASYDSKFFSLVLKITKRKFTLGLSATLEEKEKSFLLKEGGLQIIDTITEEEAEREGYITPSLTYNLAIKLSSKDQKFNTNINDKFRYYFSKFDHEFNLVRACNSPANTSMFVKFRSGITLNKTGAEWRKYWAQRNGWDGNPAHPYSPENISKYAAQAMSVIRIRKNMWHNLPSKVDVVADLVKLFPNKKILVFSESASMADAITDKLGPICRPYHTKLKSRAFLGDHSIEIEDGTHSKELKDDGYKIKGKDKLLKEYISEFERKDSGVNVLSVVRAIDEGVDIQSVEVIIMVAYHSTKRQNTQREGRGKRIDYENLAKTTIIINLYAPGTQEEKWLKKKQHGKRVVRYVKSIDEISIAAPTIKLAKKLDEVNFKQHDTVELEAA